MCVLCVLSSHSFWTSSSLDVPAGVTQEEGDTAFLIHLPSAVRALIFLARRIQPRFIDTCDEAPKVTSLLYRKVYNILPLPYNFSNPPSHTSTVGVSARTSLEFGG